MYRNKERLVLASASPRRRELLARLGLEFEIFPGEEEEDTGKEEEDPEASAKARAEMKALSAARKRGGDAAWFLGVDTIVVLDGEMLGKPASEDQARDFLARLSGKWHRVVSGYCLYRQGEGRKVCAAVSTRVKMKRIAAEEIEAYIKTREPFDKAGAYGIQGLGAALVEAVEGSWTNVVGLPLCEVVSEMLRLGIVEPEAETRG